MRWIQSAMLMTCFALASSTWARAGSLIYSTGFEAPTFSTGPLKGQNGWGQDIGNPSAITVQSSIFKTGGQAVSISATGEPDFTRAYVFKPFDTSSNPEKIVDVKVDVYLASSSNPSEYRVGGLDGTGYSLGDAVIRPDGQLLILGDVVAGTNTTVTRAKWHNYDFRFDFSNSTLSLLYDGALVASGIGFETTGSSAFLGPVFMVEPGKTGTDQAYFDNLTVTALSPVPEPSTLTLFSTALIALGGGSLLRNRRRS